MIRWTLCLAIGVAILVSASSSMTAQSVPLLRFDPEGDFVRPLDIMGEVNRAGTFPIIDAPTLAQLLEMAGGLTRAAGSTAVLIHFRESPPLVPLARARLADLARSGSVQNISVTRIALTSQNVRPEVDSGDILFIPSKNES